MGDVMRTQSKKLTLSERMARIRKTDTKPEIAVRSTAHALGYRFRLHRRDLPGTPDLVFPGRHKIIMVHGCFWHQHDCPLGRKQPVSRTEYWGPKLARNIAQDNAALTQLNALGWEVCVVWECETRDRQRLAEIIKQFLS